MQNGTPLNHKHITDREIQLEKLGDLKTTNDETLE